MGKVSRIQRARDEKGRFVARELSPEELKLLKKEEAKKLAKYHAPSAIRILADIMYDSDVRPDVRVAAAREIIDRAEGKPKAAAVDVEGPVLRIIVGDNKKGKKESE